MNIVVANWKMNPQTAREARGLFDSVVMETRRLKNVETVICPPACFLSLFAGSRSAKIGAQNIFWESEGAYTGEISGRMVKDFGCKYIILGHSERRRWMGESDEIINLKIKETLKLNLTPVFCIGEEAGEEIQHVLDVQLKAGLKDISKNQIKEIIIAYEPVWAIGTGEACLPDNAFRANLLIKKILTALYGRFMAEKTPVLYGGSVDSRNAAGYIEESKMNGLLVGGASLDKDEFVKIVSSINSL